MKIIIVITITLYVKQPPLPPTPVVLAMRLTLSESCIKPQRNLIHRESAA